MFNTKIEFYVGLTSQAGIHFEANWAVHDNIAPLFAEAGIDGFTVVESSGYWKGVAERSIVVTVFAEDTTAPDGWPMLVANSIASLLDQETVLVSVTHCNAALSN